MFLHDVFKKPSVIACCGAKEFDPQRVITDGFWKRDSEITVMEDYEPLTLNLTLTLTQTLLSVKPNSNPNPNPET